MCVTLFRQSVRIAASNRAPVIVQVLNFLRELVANELLDPKCMARKILENNPDLSELLATYLNAVGYETSQAGNSAQGISKALIERPDIIVTDLNLPDMTAIEATEILKRNPLTSAIPIVVLTATSFGGWKDKAHKAGVAEYLIKPIPPPALAEVLRRVIDTVSHLTEL